MIINLLSDQPYEIDEEGFWIQFFEVLVAKGRYTMSPKLIALMSWILKQPDPNKCWVSNPHVLELAKGFKIQRPEISVFKDHLLELGLLVSIKEPGKRLNTRPSPKLLKIKEKYLAGEVIDLRFVMVKKNAETSKNIRRSTKPDSQGLSDFQSESRGSSEPSVSDDEVLHQQSSYSE
jgi:hypothetical protein